MFHRFAVAFGAGAAAALLFAVSAQTSPLAMALAYLAPLPIMIATLGWGLDAGGIAAAVAAVALGVLAEPLTGLLFAASVAAPAWVLAAFSVTPVRRYFAADPNAPTYAPVGAIVTLACAIGVLGAAAVLTTFIIAYGGYVEAAKQVSAALAVLAADAFEGGKDGEAAKQLGEALVRLGPAAFAASTLLMLCVNLYAGARSTQLSHRLSRPWPDLPSSLHLSWPLGVLLVACVAGAYFLRAPASQFFSIGAGGIGAAFVLQGLAVTHALSRGLKLRPVMLAALYACCLLRANYTLPVLAALGVIDAFVSLRARVAFLPTANPRPQK